MGSVIVVSPGSSFATQTYPKITVTTSNPSYTTPGDTITAKGQKDVYWRQVSYYLVPLNLVKAGARLTVDFSGQRSGFVVSDLTLSQGAPAFARLDEYDTPGEPDDEALAGLLAREYPDDFRS